MAANRFQRAIVRPPGASFAQGLTVAGLGAPDLARALDQHAAYVRALESCGLEVERLPPDDRFPDSTFVEDTAVLAERCPVLARPGAPSRRGEAEAIAPALARWFPLLESIPPPGTVDGGDICVTASCVFIKLSERTNATGADALARLLERAGHPTRKIDIHGDGLLHLKTGLTDLGEGRLLVAPQLAGRPELEGFEIVVVGEDELYCANAVRINDRVLFAAGFPRTEGELRRRGFSPLVLEMSEFQKMDGGLSCLSLRF